MSGNQIFGLICIALGTLGVWYASRAMARRKALLRNPVRTKAEVVRLVQTAGDSDGPDYYVPTVRFTVNKESVEKDIDPTKDTKTFALGRNVAVIYEKGNPSNVIAAADKASNAVACWIVITISALVLGFGLLLAFGVYGFVVVPAK